MSGSGEQRIISVLVTDLVERPWVHGFWTTPIMPGRISDLVVRR